MLDVPNDLKLWKDSPLTNQIVPDLQDSVKCKYRLNQEIVWIVTGTCWRVDTHRSSPISCPICSTVKICWWPKKAQEIHWSCHYFSNVTHPGPYAWQFRKNRWVPGSFLKIECSIAHIAIDQREVPRKKSITGQIFMGNPLRLDARVWRATD